VNFLRERDDVVWFVRAVSQRAAMQFGTMLDHYFPDPEPAE